MIIYLGDLRVHTVIIIGWIKDESGKSCGWQQCYYCTENHRDRILFYLFVVYDNKTRIKQEWWQNFLERVVLYSTVLLEAFRYSREAQNTFFFTLWSNDGGSRHVLQPRHDRKTSLYWFPTGTVGKSCRWIVLLWHNAATDAQLKFYLMVLYTRRNVR